MSIGKTIDGVSPGRPRYPARHLAGVAAGKEDP
jgi:hypothetical protein